MSLSTNLNKAKTCPSTCRRTNDSFAGNVLTYQVVSKFSNSSIFLHPLYVCSWGHIMNKFAYVNDKLGNFVVFSEAIQTESQRHATAIFATEHKSVSFTTDAFWRGRSSFAWPQMLTEKSVNIIMSTDFSVNACHAKPLQQMTDVVVVFLVRTVLPLSCPIIGNVYMHTIFQLHILFQGYAGIHFLFKLHSCCLCSTPSLSPFCKFCKTVIFKWIL